MCYAHPIFAFWFAVFRDAPAWFNWTLYGRWGLALGCVYHVGVINGKELQRLDPSPSFVIYSAIVGPMVITFCFIGLPVIMVYWACRRTYFKVIIDRIEQQHPLQFLFYVERQYSDDPKFIITNTKTKLITVCRLRDYAEVRDQLSQQIMSEKPPTQPEK